jgi:hypothetical protein
MLATEIKLSVAVNIAETKRGIIVPRSANMLDAFLVVPRCAILSAAALLVLLA